MLAAALKSLGAEVTPIPWTEIDPYSDLNPPPILIRSTWDYHRMPTMFSSWLASLEDSGRRMWNAASIARGNIDKIYLKDLEAKGIAIPKTRWIDNADHDSIAAFMSEERWTRAILKPRIAATAYGTYLVDAAATLDDDAFAPARSSGALLQEVIPEVAERGEMSLVYFAGEFSHAVLKRSKAGDFRVQKDFGGTVTAIDPSVALRAFADRVVKTIPTGALYARVDVVDAARGPLLMELELIEPELYFLYVPEAADRLAAAIVAQLT